MGNGYSGRHRSGDRGRRAAAQRRPGGRGRQHEIEPGTGLRLRPEQAGCPYCGGSALSRFGRTPQGAQRWHCRTCGRKHQATTGTALAGLWQPHKFDALLADMLGPEPSSCRRLASALQLDKSTVWHWRQKASHGFVVPDRTALIEPIRTGVAVVRESRKASREWVNHRRDPTAHPEPDRLRWVDYRRLGLVAPDHLPRYRIPIEISVDRVGQHAAEVLDSLRAEHWPHAASTAPGADQPAASGAATPQTSREASHLGARRSSGADEVDRGLAELGRFLRPFRGPATRHLPAYVAWFVTRKERGELPGTMTARCPDQQSIARTSLNARD